jgi:hypothetical protein
MVQGTSIRSLMTPLIAAACPQLELLKFVHPELAKEIALSFQAPYAECLVATAQPSETPCSCPRNIFTTNAGEALPLATCSSLRQLDLTDAGDYALQQAFHTPAELRASLPNIDTLALPYPDATLLKAFSTQLTRLDIYDSLYEDYEAYQQFQQCSKLRHLSLFNFKLPDSPFLLESLDVGFIPGNEWNQLLQLPNLTTLRLGCMMCSDDDIKMLLQMSTLTTLRVEGLGNIQHNWSDYACSWQTLHFECFPDFSSLAKLCLGS